MRRGEKNSFLVLDHRQELQVRTRARTLEDLFEQALLGLAHAMSREERGKPGDLSIDVRVSSLDVNSLLVDFLSEALWQSELYTAVFSTMKLKRFTNSSLEAELSGRRVFRFHRFPKTVLHQSVHIIRNPDGLWQTDIILE
jgi:SHS2 domain-containing protein